MIWELTLQEEQSLSTERVWGLLLLVKESIPKFIIVKLKINGESYAIKY